MGFLVSRSILHHRRPVVLDWKKFFFGYEWSLDQTNVTFQSTSTSTRKYRLDHVLDHRTRLWFIVYEFPLIHIAEFENFLVENQHFF